MTNRLNITIDPKLKNQAATLYNNLGMSLSTAVKTFFKQSIYDHGMPFRPQRESPVPTESTKEAMNEADHSKKYKSYHNENDMWKDITK